MYVGVCSSGTHAFRCSFNWIDGPMECTFTLEMASVAATCVRRIFDLHVTFMYQFILFQFNSIHVSLHPRNLTYEKTLKTSYSHHIISAIMDIHANQTSNMAVTNGSTEVSGSNDLVASPGKSKKRIPRNHMDFVWVLYRFYKDFLLISFGFAHHMCMQLLFNSDSMNPLQTF